MDSTFATYKLVSRDLSRSLKLKAAEPSVALETKSYLNKISTIKTVDEFLKDTRTFNYAMKAFGLEDMAYAKGYMRKILTEGITDKNAFANRLNDDRFVKFAKAFDFDTYGPLTTSRDAVKQPVVDMRVQQSLEVDQGLENEGVRLALYFKRTAPGVKSAMGILADPALPRVAKTVLGLPDSMGSADIAKQAAAISTRLDVASLKDPAKLDRFIQRFTLMHDLNTGAGSDPIMQLFTGGSSVGDNFGLSLLSLKRGG